MILFISMPGAFELMVVFGVLLAFIVPFILFLRSLQSTLESVAIENRAMNPGNVWLMLIPLFNIVYQFILVQKVADSLRAEFAARQVTVDEERPTYTVGLSMAITYCLTLIPVIKVFASLAVMVLFIVYWVRVVKYKRMIELPTFDSI